MKWVSHICKIVAAHLRNSAPTRTCGYIATASKFLCARLVLHGQESFLAVGPPYWHNCLAALWSSLTGLIVIPGLLVRGLMINFAMSRYFSQREGGSMISGVSKRGIFFFRKWTPKNY